MAKNKVDPRDRATLQLQLDITRSSDKRDENLALLDYIDNKKKTRKAKETVRSALMLYENLEHGETEQLLSQFPSVMQALRDKVLVELLEGRLSELFADVGSMQFKGTGRAKSLQQEDIDIEFEIKRDTSANPGLNFLRSVMGATGNMLPITDDKPKALQPKQLTVAPIALPDFDDDDDVLPIKKLTSNEL